MDRISKVIAVTKLKCAVNLQCFIARCYQDRQHFNDIAPVSALSRTRNKALQIYCRFKLCNRYNFANSIHLQLIFYKQVIPIVIYTSISKFTVLVR